MEPGRGGGVIRNMAEGHLRDRFSPHLLTSHLQVRVWPHHPSAHEMPLPASHA